MKYPCYIYTVAMAYMAVAWHVCDRTLVLGNVGYKCLNQFRNDPLPPPPPPGLLSTVNPPALSRAQIPPCPSPFNAGHAGYSRPGPASYTLQPFIASESLPARLAYNSSSNFASGRVFVFFAAKASDRARAGANYRNRK